MRDNDVKKTSAIAFALIVVAALLWLIIGIPEAKGQVNALVLNWFDSAYNYIDTMTIVHETIWDKIDSTTARVSIADSSDGGAARAQSAQGLTGYSLNGTHAPADGEFLKFYDDEDTLGWDSPSGSGDMLKATYDVNTDNFIDPAAGGTGVGTLTDGGVLIGNAAGVVQATAVLTNGQLLIGDGTTDPTVATMTEGTGMTVTNGAGSITLATTLGTDIVTGEIADGTILEADLDISNAAVANYVLTSDGSTAFTWAEDQTGGSTIYNSIGDPNAAGSITFEVAETGTYTSAADGWPGITISNTVADVTSKASALLSLEYTDDGDDDVTYLVGMDNSGADTLFVAHADGIFRAKSIYVGANMVLDPDSIVLSEVGVASEIEDSLNEYAFLTAPDFVTDIDITNATDAASVQVIELEGDRATPGDNDEVYASWYLSDDASNQDEFARISAVATDVSTTEEDAKMTVDLMVAGSLTEALVVNPTSMTIGGVAVQTGADDELTEEEVEDYVGTMVDGGTETNIAVTYTDGGDGAGLLNFVVADAFLVNNASDATTGVLTATGFTIGAAAITEAELEVLDGAAATLTTDELNHLDGVTSAIQTQLDAKEVQLDNEAGLYAVLSDVTEFIEAGDALPGDDIVDGSVDATELGTDAVSADELNATGVEAELEAVLDLDELQGTIGDAQIAAAAVDGGAAGEIADGTVDANDIDETDDYAWTGTHNMGGGTFEPPNGTNPTTATTQMAIDSDDEAFEVYITGESESALIPFYQKIDACIFAPDGVADVITLLKVDALLYPHGIEIDQISYTLPADAAYGIGFHEWTGADPPVFSAQIDSLSTTDSEAYKEDGSPTDGAIAADATIRASILSTDVDWVHIQIIYHVTEGD